jgi:hypothetical protein
MLFLILSIQIVVVLAITICILYKYLFKDLFVLVSIIVLLAFIPNLATSLSISNNYITNIESQILFGITGFIVLIALWTVLKDKPL